MVFTELLKQMTCHSLYGHPLAAAATTMQLAHWNFVLHSLTQVGWFEDKGIKSPLYTEDEKLIELFALMATALSPT